MGLDMYLFKAHKNKDNIYNKEDLIEIGYWCKSYAIDRWFERHCNIIEVKGFIKIYEVTRTDLMALLQTCELVIENHTLIEDLLPSIEMLFDDDKSNEEWYFKTITHTIEIINNALKINFDTWNIFFYPNHR